MKEALQIVAIVLAVFSLFCSGFSLFCSGMAYRAMRKLRRLRGE